MSSLSNNEFNRLYIANGIQTTLNDLARKTGVVENRGGMHGDTSPDGEFFPHSKETLSFDPPV